MISVKDEEMRKVVLPEKLEFGKLFTPHMFEMDYDENLGGWLEPKIVDFANLSMHPASMVFHYGLEIFEGLKAYKQIDGKIALFRPEKNFERLNRSAARLSMPQVDIDLALQFLNKLILIDKDWIPTQENYSLYIRPLLIATDPILGVRPATKFKLLFILSPVGPYYPEGFRPIAISATDKYVRAVRKGIGECKTGGNYAASLLAQKEARARGYSQVLWLDGVEQKFIEEVGTMNLFVRFKNEIVTSPLTGSILPGVTRDAVITILKGWNYNIVERRVLIEEVYSEYANGNLIEIFGTGTAAVISSVNKLEFNDRIIDFQTEEAGELASRLYNEITDIQFGKIEDTHDWIKIVE